MLPPTFSWLNEQFMEKVLKSWKNDDSIKVTDLESKFATAVGDNYMSDMIRANVKYSRNNSGCKEIEKKSVIIKIVPVANKKMLTDLGIYNTEIEMMKNTLVKMNKLLNEEDCHLSAEILYTDNGENPLIVMEDLKELGYRPVDRVIGLDVDHCIVALRKLAKFHASSVALWEKDPEVTASHTIGLFHKGNPQQFKQMLNKGIRVFGKELLNWPELGETAQSYSDKFLELSTECYDKTAECAKRKVDGFNVLSHGDFWVNNILFRYNDEGKVVDSILVDFQFSSWTSPAVDLISFANISLTEDVELHHRHTLLEEYLRTLSETMLRLGCSTKAPTMKELKKALREYKFMEIIYSCVFLPTVLTPTTASATLDEFMKRGDTFVSPGYKSPGYRRRMLKRLSAWKASGVLDF